MDPIQYVSAEEIATVQTIIGGAILFVVIYAIEELVMRWLERRRAR